MENRFEDLVLLIGTNPLPNYVALKYFIEKSNIRRVWMFCSEETNFQQSTKEYAENLKNISSDSQVSFEEIIYIQNINKKKSIKEATNKLLEKMKEKEIKTAHLFYTGGTKSMAVHIYNFLANNDKGINFTFSYLSARDFKIYFDDNDSISDGLRKKIKISFGDLCKLHSFEIKEDTNNNMKIYEKPLNKMYEYIQNGTIDEFLNSKGNGYNRNLFLDNNKILSKTRIKENINNFEPNDVFLKICNSFPDEYKLFDENKNFNEKVTKNGLRKIIKDFLDGKWLEMYVAKVLEEKKLEDYEPLLNKEVFKKDNDNNNFELDIVLMKGYQLIGISITTSKNKHLCKSKGFEIILRTRQIGGAEAKAILITGGDSDNVSKLQEELILSTGTSKENILVVGKEDWKKENLIHKIENFIN